MTNREIINAVNREVYWGVYGAVMTNREINNAVDREVYWDVERAVNRAVDVAVSRELRKGGRHEQP